MRFLRNQKGFTEKLNNKGTTLLEMLVAIAILTLVVVVIFSGFASSTRLNAKSRIRHNATMLAQDLLEGLKAEDLQGILYKFSVPAETIGRGEDAKHYVYFDLLPLQVLPVRSVNNPLPEELCENIGTFEKYIDTESGVTDYIPSEDGIYQLYINKAKMDGLEYDVVVTLDGSAYKDGSKGKNYNTEHITRIANMDLTYDALVSNSNVYDKEGLFEIKAFAGAAMDNSKVQRRITIHIDETEILNPDYPYSSKVTATYEYLYNGTVVDVEEDVVFNNLKNPELQLRNIFLFLEPMYGYGEDEFVIENEENRDVEIYMVKQQTMTDLSRLTTKENAYKSHVLIKENPTSWKEEEAGATKIRTNLTENLGDGRNVESQVRVTYQTPYMILSERSKFYEKTDWNDLANRQEKEMLFDVTIEVYRNEEEVLVFTGSIRN